MVKNASNNLAQDRTHLANERTLLAYLRTALTFFALGAFLIKFVPTKFYTVLGMISIIFGLAFIVYGIKRFSDFKKRIDNMQ